MQSVALLLTLVVPFLLVETARSSRNERRLRDCGAIEPAGDVYRWMRPIYPGMFLAMAAEGYWHGAAPMMVVTTGVAVFLLAKALKWAAILSLGDFWSFRVLVLPGARLVTGGPYRVLRHPNYVALAGEVLGAAIMWRAFATGLVSAVVFGGLLMRRIAQEEAALGLRPPRAGG